ncbi:hypothetical protein F4818DRAFT_456629 [Hypoxylon cercidicola]|nr:hypothetical protein F4818DRAFT_456629 [Hypoxylon cercidicola]
MATPNQEEHATNNGEHGTNNESNCAGENVAKEDDEDPSDIALSREDSETNIPPSIQSPLPHGPRKSLPSISSPVPLLSRLQLLSENQLPEASRAGNTMPADDQPGKDEKNAEGEAKNAPCMFQYTRAIDLNPETMVEMGSYGDREKKIQKLPEISIPPPGETSIPTPFPRSEMPSVALPEYLHGSSIQLPVVLPPRFPLPLPSKQASSGPLPRRLLCYPVFPGLPPRLHLREHLAPEDPGQKFRSKQPHRNARSSHEENKKLRRKKKSEQLNENYNSMPTHSSAIGTTTEEVSNNEARNSDVLSTVETTTQIDSSLKIAADAGDSKINAANSEELEKTVQADCSKPAETRAVQSGCAKPTESTT